MIPYSQITALYVSSSAEAQARGLDDGSEYIGDPFADAEHYDFSLRVPVRGFTPIELPRVGPYSDLS